MNNLYQDIFSIEYLMIDHSSSIMHCISLYNKSVIGH